ncbi:hypothetical protein C8Q70DRAFT_982550 [Cubamyces menziesii]|nr:hypothetical protein C8Q70DRAFT_982550 [Cubamyces menziesii]
MNHFESGECIAQAWGRRPGVRTNSFVPRYLLYRLPPCLMPTCSTELASHIRMLAIPFAPVIISRAGATLIAQTYISSHPATGLLLISPPPSNASVPQSLLPTPLEEFIFEARFPCAILCAEAEQSRLAAESRLWKDPGVDKIVVQDEDAVVGQQGVVQIEQWLDELGI